MITKAHSDEGIVYADIGELYSFGCSSYQNTELLCLLKYFVSPVDLEYLSEVRQQLPITKQRRDDLYAVEAVNEG